MCTWSTWFLACDRNPQQFVDPYTAAAEDHVTATHTVYPSAEHPSRVPVQVLL